MQILNLGTGRRLRNLFGSDLCRRLGDPCATDAMEAKRTAAGKRMNLEVFFRG
jgi:hypothetical protein